MNYKPDIQSKVANSLNRFLKSSQNLEEYGKICTVKEVKAIFDGSLNQTNGKKIWIPLVNGTTAKKKDEEDQVVYDATDKAIALTTQDLVNAQKEES